MLIGAFTWVKLRKGAQEEASDEALGEGSPEEEGDEEMCFEGGQDDPDVMTENEDARSSEVGPHRGEHDEKEKESPRRT